MTKRQEAKRAALLEQYGRKNLNVGELVALLKTYPQDLPVTGFNGQEQTDFVTCAGVEKRESTGGWFGLRLPDGSQYVGDFVDIMGL